MNRERDRLAEAIRDTLISPNECDSNGEAPGPTDGLFALARAVYRLAEVAEKGFGRVAAALHELAAVTENGIR
jgi:hypothetical protein